jgi:hypothetical protein
LVWESVTGLQLRDFQLDEQVPQKQIYFFVEEPGVLLTESPMAEWSK